MRAFSGSDTVQHNNKPTSFLQKGAGLEKHENPDAKRESMPVYYTMDSREGESMFKRKLPSGRIQYGDSVSLV